MHKDLVLAELVQGYHQSSLFGDKVCLRSQREQFKMFVGYLKKQFYFISYNLTIKHYSISNNYFDNKQNLTIPN